MSVFDVPLTSAPVNASDWQEVSIHPLVVLGFADHFTASAASAVTVPKMASKHKIGILLGTHQKKLTDICFTFELIPTATSAASSSNGTPDIFDKEVAVQRRDMLKAVYAGQEVVGWYLIGSSLPEGLFDAINTTVKDVFDVDGPLVAIVDVAAGASNTNKLFPINLLETLTDEMIAKSPSIAATNKAKKISFSFASTESERIGTDTLFRLDNTKRQTKESNTVSSPKEAATADQRSLLPLAGRLSNSVQLLDTCIQTVMAYVEAVKKGDIKDPDPDTLRLIMTVAQSLPFSKTQEGDGSKSTVGDAANRDFTEGLLLAYVAVVQKSAMSLANLQVATNQMIDQQSADGVEELTRARRGGFHGAGNPMASAMQHMMGNFGF